MPALCVNRAAAGEQTVLVGSISRLSGETILLNARKLVDRSNCETLTNDLQLSTTYISARPTGKQLFLCDLHAQGLLCDCALFKS